MIDNIPCSICGHFVSSHKGVKDGYGISPARGKHWCSECNKQLEAKSLEDFHTYVPDNLSYIEKLAKERNLI